MRPAAEFIRFYGFGGFPVRECHLRILYELIRNVEAKERIEAASSINENNIRDLAMLAYDDPKIAERMENKLLNSKPKKR